jgi:hypothetical protein
MRHSEVTPGQRLCLPGTFSLLILTVKHSQGQDPGGLSVFTKWSFVCSSPRFSDVPNIIRIVLLNDETLIDTVGKRISHSFSQ